MKNKETMKELMRPSVKDEWGIKELQNCILNITKYIHDFCEQYNIKYCIMGGTALGAVRHGGFIPWDDDIDLFMTPEEYARFRTLFKEKGNHERFYLQEKGVSHGIASCAKLRLNNSSFIEEMTENWDIHKGIFVDIMILQNYPDGKLDRFWMLLWTNYLYIKDAANLNYSRKGRFANALLIPFKWLPKLFLRDYAVKQVRKYDNTRCNNYFHYYMRFPLSHSIYPKELFKKYDLIDFETVQLRAPVGIKKYLSILFGDYMKIPDINKIRFCQHTKNWSIDTPFEKRGKGIFEDEKYL